MNTKQRKQDEARDNLLANYIKPEDTILIVIKSVSSSGMCRRMRVMTSSFSDITYLIADLCDLSMNNTGLRIQGCGMDMTFWLANHITYCLWDKEEQKKLSDKLTGNGLLTCLKYKNV